MKVLMFFEKGQKFLIEMGLRSYCRKMDSSAAIISMSIHSS